MEIGAALLLGLFGSVHCAGMCGPLALALPASGASRMTFYLGRAGYNAGRISAYALLGVAFGVVGKTFALAGFQAWASIISGGVILLALIPAAGVKLGRPASGAVSWFKSIFARLLRQRSLMALYLLGLLNGFLPCGLAYVAGASAVALGSVSHAVAYMIAFGLGTVPMMLGIGLLGRSVQLTARIRLQKLLPVCFALVGLLLILRGMSLGIPYVSPDLTSTKPCHTGH